VLKSRKSPGLWPSPLSRGKINKRQKTVRWFLLSRGKINKRQKTVRWFLLSRGKINKRQKNCAVVSFIKGIIDPT